MQQPFCSVSQPLVAQLVKNLPAVWETWVRSLGWEDGLRRERLPTPVFWPGEFHGVYNPCGRKEPDMTDFHSVPLISPQITFLNTFTLPKKPSSLLSCHFLTSLLPFIKMAYKTLSLTTSLLFYKGLQEHKNT